MGHPIRTLPQTERCVGAVEVIRIEDPDDPRYRQFRLNERGLASRTDKRDDAGAGMFLAEGDLVVERALAAGCRPVAALVDIERVPPVAAELALPGLRRRGRGPPGRLAPRRAAVHHHALPTTTRGRRWPNWPADATRLVVVEGVDNPSNIGSIIRNAAALGWDGLILDHTSADPLARRSLRVAMGTVFALPHARTLHARDRSPAPRRIRPVRHDSRCDRTAARPGSTRPTRSRC